MRTWVRIGRGDLDGALADAEWALDVGRRSGEPQSLYPAVGTMAYALIAAGRHETARPLAEEMMARWEEGVQTIPFQGSAEIATNWIHLVGIERARHVLSALSTPTPWLEAALAILAKNYSRALEIYTRAESVTDQSYTHLLAAESLIEHGRSQEADVHVRSALAFYRSVRASYYIARAEKLLAASA